MEYEKFENELLSYLIDDNKKKKCIDLIENNKNVIQIYLNEAEKPFHLENLIKKLNEIIIEKLKKFKLIEKVLRHDLFTKVLSEFRESNVLIEACKKVKVDVIKWLLKMDINYLVQDEDGMTALMYAIKYPSLVSISKKLLKNKDIVYLSDKNDETVIFHALSNYEGLKLFFEKDYNVDFNHINKNNENLLIKSCKNNNFSHYESILKRTEDINLVDNDGKTVAMYLVEKCRPNELRFLKDKNLNVNYKNENNETLVSIIMKNFNEIYTSGSQTVQLRLENCIRTMIVSMFLGCNLNTPFDKEGNTPIMYFMMVKDYFSTTFLIERYKDLDLSIKNENGISASYLSVTINPLEKKLKEIFIKHKTFDFNYSDSSNNNLLMYFIAKNETITNENSSYIYTILNKAKNPLGHVNNKNENAAILSTKLGRLCTYYVDENSVNQQDYLGNTALHYAIKMKDKKSINILSYYKANPNIKNNDGISPLDLAKTASEDCTFDIFDILNNPLRPEDMASKIEKEGKTFLIFDKNKSTDEKVEDYAKNYQINIYKNEYKYLIKNKDFTYPLIVNKPFIDECLIDIYYGFYETDAPKAMKNERIEDKRRKVAHRAYAIHLLWP